MIEINNICKKVIDLATNPRIGLPDPVFDMICQLTPLINVELIVRSPRKGSVLAWRDDRNFGPGWHIPGGVVRLKETAEDRACLVGEIELNLAIHNTRLSFVHVHEQIAYSKIRGHCIGLVYSYEIELENESNFQDFNENLDYGSGETAWHKTCPANLIKEHLPLANYIFQIERYTGAVRKSQTLFY